MKGKTISAITIVLLALSILAVLPVLAQTAEMYIDPAYTGGLDLGETFTVTVMAKNFVDLFTWGVEITFDPSVLQCSALYFSGGLPGDVFDVLAPGVMTIPMSGGIDNINGKVTLTAVTLVGATGVTGELDVGYKLIAYDFMVVGYTGSVSLIHLNEPDVNCQLLDPAQEIILCIYTDAEVETVSAPAPFGPTAAFTWLPTVPIEGTEVTFDASASTPGFDGTVMCPITQYRWDFAGDAVNTGTPITAYTFGTAGDYAVTLEVYAPGAVPETDSIMKTVKVIPPPMGAVVDLTAPGQAPYDGEGPDVECDAFAPQQEILLCAKVTYNLDPVEGKLVAFEVHDGEDNIILVRTETTGADGIACITFRIPSMPAFGDWIAIVTVDVAETIAADTMPFKVGWIVEILSVEPEATSYHKCEDMYFILTIKNIALSTQITTLTVVVYDALGVPIGQITVPDWSISAGFEGPYMTTVGIHAATWAFISPPAATVYANAYTALPSAGGVPFCPEASAEFMLES